LEKKTKNEAFYNILNFNHKLNPKQNASMIMPPKRTTKTNKSAYTFNIVNMQALKGKEEEVRKMDEVNIVVPQNKIVRDFDIVSNHYCQNNEEIQRNDRDLAKSESINKLVKRVINPVTMK